jgi:hypothetical protein
MPVGKSGRIVVEMDPDLKRELYAVLAKNGITLKDWFLRNAQRYVSSSVQPSLFVAENTDTASYEHDPVQS